MCVFQQKTGHILVTVRDTAKVIIKHWLELVYGFKNEMKIIYLNDLKGHWQPVWSTILATGGLLVYKCLVTLTQYTLDCDDNET